MAFEHDMVSATVGLRGRGGRVEVAEASGDDLRIRFEQFIGVSNHAHHSQMTITRDAAKALWPLLKTMSDE